MNRKKNFEYGLYMVNDHVGHSGKDLGYKIAKGTL